MPAYHRFDVPALIEEPEYTTEIISHPSFRATREAMPYVFVANESKEQWLTQRMNVVTGTDVAKLCTGGPIIKERLAQEKRTPSAPLPETKALRWGHEREPFIIESINKHFNVELLPNTMLTISKEHALYACTPDAVSKDFVSAIAECKTHNGEIEAIPPLHEFQIRWNMFVTGAKVGYYAVEEHVDYVPTALKVFVVEHDEAMIDYMTEEAEEFIDKYWQPEAQRHDTFNPELDALIEQYRELAERKKQLESEEKKLKDRVRTILGPFEETAYMSNAGSISAAYSKPRLTMDTKRMLEEVPEIVEMYGKYTESKLPTLRITPAKEN